MKCGWDVPQPGDDDYLPPTRPRSVWSPLLVIMILGIIALAWSVGTVGWEVLGCGAGLLLFARLCRAEPAVGDVVGLVGCATLTLGGIISIVFGLWFFLG